MRTMNEFWTKPLMAMTAGLAMCLTVSVAVAQNEPKPDGPPVEITDFGDDEDDPAAAAFSTDPNAPQALRVPKKRVPLGAGYRSDMLQGEFLAQWMTITDANGRTYLFWGARILNLDPKSPLKAISLRPGDVITRLDGDKISIGMNRRNAKAPYQLVELDQHYGLTDVRFIFKSTQLVQELKVNLGPQGGGGGRLPVPVAP